MREFMNEDVSRLYRLCIKIELCELQLSPKDITSLPDAIEALDGFTVMLDA